ncbi:MAG: hypothetical protein E6H65_05355 [Betaproteobacteria bacterium]|nr:MAG: hypothetical protein E6H65_05355 [Betaproteobacteria bacterium]
MLLVPLWVWRMLRAVTRAVPPLRTPPSTVPSSSFWVLRLPDWLWLTLSMLTTEVSAMAAPAARAMAAKRTCLNDFMVSSN